MQDGAVVKESDMTLILTQRDLQSVVCDDASTIMSTKFTTVLYETRQNDRTKSVSSYTNDINTATGHTIRYDTIRHSIFTCAQKLEKRWPA